jgi:hypothetical protein
MVFKTLLLFLVLAILMEDGSSIRKTEDERKEDEELAKAVNKTLAEEEKKWKEDENEAKRKKDEGNKKKKEQDKSKDEENRDKKKDRQGEDCLPINVTCPVVDQCLPCERCEDPVSCPDPVECPPVECGPCDPCPEVPGPQHNVSCRPCPVRNATVTRVITVNQTCPATPSCPETNSSMTVPVAIAVGAAASLLVTGVALVIGLVIRYVSPTVSGFLFMAVIILVWYLSSQYPETARELGGRAWTALQEATVALGHRVMEAIRHHHEQVGLPVKFYSPLRLEFHFSFRKVCTKIFYVIEKLILVYSEGHARFEIHAEKFRMQHFS